MLDFEIIGEGATTKVYRDGEKAIKLYVNAPPDEAENEAKRQSFAFCAGLPVPAVFGVRKLDERMTALDMEYIPGKPLLHTDMDKEERRSAINILAQLQCTVHKVNADGLPGQAERLAWKIEHTHHLNRPVKDSLFTLLRQLDEKKNSLCHGDFHPYNILYDGQKHWIIDWVDAVSGDPFADACRTYLIFLQYMTRSAGIYLRAFCKASGVKQEKVLAWLPIVAAARLNENMDDKPRAVLLDIINKWQKMNK